MDDNADNRLMNMKTHRLSLVVTATVALPSLCFGLGIRVPDQDAFAVARGNAFVATADNPSAIYYNPAGITQIEDMAFRAGVYGIFLKDEYEGAAGEFETEDKYGALPAVLLHDADQRNPADPGVGFLLSLWAGPGLVWQASVPFPRQ